MKVHSSLLSDITNRLASISDTPALDAAVLIGNVIRQPRTWVMAHPDLQLTSEQQKDLNAALERLERGVPFPYVLGHWEFFGLDFEVTPDVLIPRPETELLVEKAIVWLQGSKERKFVADVGTGSGAIAVTLAKHVPYARILATDISFSALRVAKRNAEKYAVAPQIDFVNCDLLPPYPLSPVSHFNLICANLPYIPTRTLQALQVFGREPTLALDGGDDGLRLLHRLLKIAPARLVPNGMILLEIEATLGAQAFALARDAFPGASITLKQDLTGRDRLLQIALNG
jgi:release factor glutamine methyltransferase